MKQGFAIFRAYGGPLPRSRSNHSAYLVHYIVVALLFSTCVRSPAAAKRIAAFSAATSVAATSTAGAFEAVERSYYQTQVAALTVNYDTSGFDPKSIRPFLSVDDLEVRSKVLKGLQMYAEKLADIMSDRQLTEFDSQTKAFGQSLVDMKSSTALTAIAARVPDTDLKVFTAAVDSLGRWFIESKRQKEIPKIVSGMQKPVQEICTFFIADIGQPPGPNGRTGRGLRDQLWRQFEQKMMLQDAFIQKNKDKLDPRTKAEEIAKLPALLTERVRMDGTLRATQSALAKLAETPNQLAAAFDKSSPTLDELIRELMSEGQRVKGFYEKLENR